MTGIEIVDTGLVYRNPKPSLCSRHAYFPTVVELLDGELLVGMDIGSIRSNRCEIIRLSFAERRHLLDRAPANISARRVPKSRLNVLSNRKCETAAL